MRNQRAGQVKGRAVYSETAAARWESSPYLRLRVVGNVGDFFGNGFGLIQVFQKTGAGVPGAVEELALGAGLDLEGDAAARAGGGGGGDVEREFAFGVALDASCNFAQVS